MKDLIVIGRFPPPVDGQSLSTQRFVTMTRSQYSVSELNTGMASDASIVQKIAGYFRSGRSLARMVAETPNAVIVWQSISPTFSGHWRDRLTILRNAGTSRIIAVNHRRFRPVFQSLLTRHSARRMIRRLSKVVFLDPELADECDAWIPVSKRAVVANSVDQSTICTRDEVDEKFNRTGTSPFRILFLSNMMKEKGYESVLRAVEIMKTRNQDIEVDFVGGWYAEDAKTAFYALIRSMNLGDIVRVHGAITDRSQIKRFHLRADAFVLPTYHPTEAQPVSIIEALSAGTPVISTEQGGIPRMIRHGIEAMMVTPERPDEIANALASLMNRDRWHTMARSARSRFESMYDPEKIQKDWIRLLEDVFSEPGPDQKDLY